MQETLEAIGLTSGESKVYLALLRKGSLTKTRIAQAAQISSSKVYEVAERLVHKGLVSKFSEGKVITYQANDPEALNTLANEKINKAKEWQEKIKAIVPKLEKEYENTPQTSVVEMHRGSEGLRTAVRELFNDMQPGAEICGLGFETEGFHLHHYHRKRLEKEIRQRMIFPPGTVNSEYDKKHSRYLTQTGDIGVGISEDRILFHEKTGKTTVVWKDQKAAESLKQLFEIWWKAAKEK